MSEKKQAITDLMKRDFPKPPYTLTPAPDQDDAKHQDLLLVQCQQIGNAIAKIYVDSEEDRNAAVYIMVACNDFDHHKSQRDKAVKMLEEALEWEDNDISSNNFYIVDREDKRKQIQSVIEECK